MISFVAAHFSTAVGAVHNSNFSIFQIGSYANRGLSQLVLTGDTHALEQELANEVGITNENATSRRLR